MSDRLDLTPLMKPKSIAVIGASQRASRATRAVSNLQRFGYHGRIFADLAEPRPGSIAIVSQSGGFSHAIAERLMRQRAVGLRYIVSCGNQAGVSVEDYVDFLVEDEDTP